MIHGRCALLLALLAIAPGRAAAQAPKGPSAAEEQLRTKLFHEGTALGEDGFWPEAAERFRAVVAIRSAPKALIALAFAEEKLDQLLESKRLLLEAEEAARAAGLDQERAMAREALERLEPRIPRFVFPGPERATGAEVLVDGKRVGVTAGAIEVDPGERTLEVRRPGRRPFTVKQTLRAGDRKEVAWDDATEPPPPATPAAPEREPAGPPLGAIVLGGTGVVATAVAFTLWGVGTSEQGDVIAACPRGGGKNDCPPELEPMGDAAASKIIAGDVVLGVGIACAAAGAAWWLFAPGGAARPAAAASRGGGWAGVAGTF